jgi:hypothetical protein
LTCTHAGSRMICTSLREPCTVPFFAQ